MYEPRLDDRRSSDSMHLETESFEKVTLLPPHRNVRPWRAILSSKTFWTALWLVSVAIVSITSWEIARRVYTARYSDVEGATSLFASIDRSYHTEWFSPFNYSTSPYTTDPRSSDVDAMWHHTLALDTANFLIPYDLKDQYHLDERRHVLIPAESTGTGRPEFIGWFEVLHQLHCLNDLRQNLWYNRDWYREHPPHGKPVSDDLIIVHTNHCLDALRERLACVSDIGVVPSLWIHSNGDALPDFHRAHECRDFGAVRKWAQEHGMQAPWRYMKFVPPEDAIYTDMHVHT